MPIYEYRCQSCSHEVEVMQKITDPPLVDCPSCQRSDLRKKLTASAFRLSGSGWYETDFKTGDKKRNLAGEGAAAGDAKPADAGKSGSDSATAASSSSGAPIAATAAS